MAMASPINRNLRPRRRPIPTTRIAIRRGTAGQPDSPQRTTPSPRLWRASRGNRGRAVFDRIYRMFGMGNDTIHYSIFNFQVGNGNPNSLSYAKPAKPKAWTPRREENSWFNHGWTRLSACGGDGHGILGSGAPISTFNVFNV